MRLPQRGLYRDCTEINKIWNNSDKKLRMPGSSVGIATDYGLDGPG